MSVHQQNWYQIARFKCLQRIHDARPAERHVRSSLTISPKIFDWAARDLLIQPGEVATRMLDVVQSTNVTVSVTDFVPVD